MLTAGTADMPRLDGGHQPSRRRLSKNTAADRLEAITPASPVPTPEAQQSSEVGSGIVFEVRTTHGLFLPDKPF
jgi:hypothetical protein